MKSIVILVSLLVGTMAQDPAAPKFPDTQEYFGLTNDLSKVKWSHAVNTKELLEKVFQDTTIQMIEADVRTATKKPEANTGKDDDVIAVMNHDPTDTYDISLEDFMAQIQKNMTGNDRKLGLKLDFKTTEAFQKASLLPVFNEIKFPLWINADILKGPGKAKDPEADITRNPEILTGTFKDALYSFGWTTADYQKDPEPEATKPEATKVDETKPEETVDPNRYSAANVDEMLAKIGEISGKFTFPVRGIYAANSVTEMERLLAKPETSLTVWSAAQDTEVISGELLEKLNDFLVMRKSRVFVDIPDDLQKKIDKLRGGAVGVLPVSGLVLGLVGALLINYF